MYKYNSFVRKPGQFELERAKELPSPSMHKNGVLLRRSKSTIMITRAKRKNSGGTAPLSGVGMNDLLEDALDARLEVVGVGLEDKYVN